MLKQVIYTDEFHNAFSMGMLYGGMIMTILFGFSDKEEDILLAMIACVWMMFWILVQVFYKRKETSNGTDGY